MVDPYHAPMLPFPRTLEDCQMLDAGQVRQILTGHHLPVEHQQAPQCPVCHASRGQECLTGTAYSFPPASHPARRAITDLMREIGFGVPDEVQVRVTDTWSWAWVPVTAVAIERPGFPEHLTFLRPRVYGSRNEVRMRVPGVDRARGRAIVVPPPLVGQVVGAWVYAPDVPVAAQLCGIALSLTPSDRFPGATLAQELHTVIGMDREDTDTLLSCMHPDGRFTVSGCVEPYPGAWDRVAVFRAAVHDDLSTLWPSLG